MTTLQDLRKVALNVAKKKQQQNKTEKTANTTQTKTAITTTQTKNNTTNNISEQQKNAIAQMQKNIQEQWFIKWNIANTKQTAENKAQQKFLSWMSNKQANDYNYLIDNWYSEKEARNIVNKVTPKTVSNWTATQQNDYDYLVSNWVSEKKAKEIIQDIRYSQIYNEQLQSNLDSGMREWKAERKAKKAAWKDIQTDWSTWKKIWTWVKWFWEWLADIWQNTLWRWVDRVAGKIITWLTWEEYTPQWDTSILSEEQQKSRIWNVSQKAWTTAWLTTLWVLWWWVAASWAWAIWAAAWSPLVWWLAWVWIWWLEWMAWTELWTLTTDKRLATWKELAIWWAIWGIAGWIWWYANAAKRLTPEYQAKYLANQTKSQANKYTVDEAKDLTKKQKSIWEMIQDTSKSWKERAIDEWRITTKKWLWWTKEIQELSQQEKNATKYITENWLYSKNKQKLFKNIQKEISKTAWEMSDDMKNIKIWDFDKKTVVDNLNSMKELPEVKGSSSTIKKINNIISQMDDVDDADKLWKVRQDYDDLFTKWQKAWFGKWWTTETAYNTWQEWRKILNDAMMDAADKAWKPQIRNGMKKLNTLINANGNLKANMTKTIWKEQLNWLWRNRKKWVWLYLWYQWLKKVKNWASWNDSDANS